MVFIACAPLSDTKDSPPAKPADITFFVTAVASSIQLEVTGVPAIIDAGAVVRLAAEATPTKTEAQASRGYVNLSIEAGSTRKFSISQHYGSNFADGGFTLADVLAPNTKYKLYLYMPLAIDLGQTEIKGGAIKGDTVEISFTTASLPAAGEAVWSEKFAAKEYVASLNEYHFMENQTGVIVAYFQSPYIPFLQEFSIIDPDPGGSNLQIGRYHSNLAPAVTPIGNFYFNMELMTGYPSTTTSRTFYMITADNGTSVLRDLLQNSGIPGSGPSHVINTAISRY
ncbi:hypothetical protein P0082_03800 [Candidatus Haliotispira prima]|uniref:DUF4249 family protein n=1 Tax=Candidatus Haliotispira prima TaxID=3034016 RepID=A0ABY8MJF8_9SPIO|nr:hypothetical protein P0082_03800 [Candidatus Haliotispira prima]